MFFSQLIAAYTLPICYCSIFCSDRWTPDVVSKKRHYETHKGSVCSTVVGRETRSGSKKFENHQRSNLKKKQGWVWSKIIGSDPYCGNLKCRPVSAEIFFHGLLPMMSDQTQPWCFSNCFFGDFWTFGIHFLSIFLGQLNKHFPVCGFCGWFCVQFNLCMNSISYGEFLMENWTLSFALVWCACEFVC